jgi:hypothetical protein
MTRGGKIFLAIGLVFAVSVGTFMAMAALNLNPQRIYSDSPLLVVEVWLSWAVTTFAFFGVVLGIFVAIKRLVHWLK